MLFNFLPILFALILSDNPDETYIPPPPISIDLANGTKVQEVTNTLLYSIQVTDFTTIITINGQETLTVTNGEHIVYIPTILMYLKAVENVPERTVTITPEATQKLKSVVLKPGILVGVTFAILFVIGVFYTSLCRKPQAARRPKATGKNKGTDESFRNAKSKRAKTRSATGSRSRANSRKPSSRARSGSNASSRRGNSHSGSRTNRKGSHSGNHRKTSRGRTSSRL